MGCRVSIYFTTEDHSDLRFWPSLVPGTLFNGSMKRRPVEDLCALFGFCLRVESTRARTAFPWLQLCHSQALGLVDPITFPGHRHANCSSLGVAGGGGEVGTECRVEWKADGPWSSGAAARSSGMTGGCSVGVRAELLTGGCNRRPLHCVWERKQLLKIVFIFSQVPTSKYIK